jgi:ribosomal-protein-alanine N-acetyltransferase
MIETERLLLRSMTGEDTDELLRVFSDPRVMASFGGQLFDRPQMERWVERNLAHQEKHGYGLFAVILRDENVLIGDCGLEHMQVGGRAEVELGYDLLSAYWRRGLASEAAAAVRDFAFGSLGLARLISLIRPANVASRRVAEKIGMGKESEIERGNETYWIYTITNRQGRVEARPLGDG